MQRYDVVIIGSGPAGSSTALNIHRMDPDLASRTVVLEKARHPREKLCGGGLTRKVDLLLTKLGLKVEVPFVQLDMLRIIYRGRNYDYLQQEWVKVIRRREFDAWLAGKLTQRGVALHQGEEVTGLRRLKDGVVVTTSKDSYKARVVVAADGVHSVVRKKADFPAGRRLMRCLVVEMPADVNKERVWLFKAMINDWACNEMGAYGYYWEFPAWEGGKPILQCGLGVMDTDPDRKVVVKQVFRSILRKRGISMDDHQLMGYPIRAYDPEYEPAQSHILLVGDASGVDLLTGEGISESLEYGVLAAETIVDAFRADDFSFKLYKQALANSRLGKEMSRNCQWAYKCFTPDWEKMVPTRLEAFKRADTLERLKV
ncbi:MAG: NAD(P)/FAD-dependent oxidoreductase [Chloroflexota bacterium]